MGASAPTEQIGAVPRSDSARQVIGLRKTLRPDNQASVGPATAEVGWSAIPLPAGGGDDRSVLYQKVKVAIAEYMNRLSPISLSVST